MKTKGIKTDPEVSWAVGRNDASIPMAGIQVTKYPKGMWLTDQDAVNFSPANRKGKLLVAGFQITGSEAIELAKAILDVMGYTDVNIKPYVEGASMIVGEEPSAEPGEGG